MRKLVYKVMENGETYGMEFITDRTSEWTVEQYSRNRNCTMLLISDLPTDETEGTSRRVNLA